MDEQGLLNQMADTVLQAVETQEERSKGVKSGRFRFHIIKVGHFNGNIWNPRFMFNRSVKVFVRLLLNIASEVDKDTFMTMIIRLGEILYQYGRNESYLNEINEAHSKSSKNKPVKD